MIMSMLVVVMVIVVNMLAPAMAVMVVGVERNSPALETGLAEGDLIIAFEDSSIASIDDLHAQLTHARVGVRSKLTVVRGGEKEDRWIVPGESSSRAHID